MRQLTPATFAQARAGVSHVNLRDRKLNLPTMCAIVVSLVWRQIPSLSEVLRLLATEGLLWVEAMDVSVEALSKRFQTLPAELFASLFQHVVTASAERRRARLMSTEASPETSAEASTEVQPTRRRSALLTALETIYSCVWIADASTLDQLRKTTTALRQQASTVLGGKMLAMVEASSHQPMAVFFEERGMANEKTFNDRLLEALPLGGLLVMDAGFFSFVLFDQFTEAGKYFITRMKAKVAYESIHVLASGPRYRDEIIEVGMYWSNPCKHPVRLVSVLWGSTWYQYLTNDLDAKRLSAQQVVELYRSRWRIEEAFLLTKRLLGLSYLWVGSSNGIQIQVWATWIFYSVLIELTAEVAESLSQPIGRISVEMVFRSLYHYSRALERDETIDVVEYLCSKAKLFALVKAERKRDRQRATELSQIWEVP